MPVLTSLINSAEPKKNAWHNHQELLLQLPMAALASLVNRAEPCIAESLRRVAVDLSFCLSLPV